MIDMTHSHIIYDCSTSVQGWFDQTAREEPARPVAAWSGPGEKPVPEESSCCRQ